MANLSDIFVRAARSLYGEQWQSPISRDLGISDRHVRRIAAGQANAQPGMLVDLSRLILERQFEMDQIIEDIKRVASMESLPEPPDDQP